MKYDFIILGGTGMQGRICARDLLESGYSVLLCGRDPSKIHSLITRWKKKSKFLRLDLNIASVVRAAIRISGARVVVNCAELGYNVRIMQACLAEKVSCTDLGGLQRVTKEQFKLHDAFEKKGIMCLTGCGSTPGIASVLARYGAEHLDNITSIDLGFAWDSEPKVFVVPYSMLSIFAEFREKPVIFEKGVFVTKNHYSFERIFPRIGTQRMRGIVHSEVYTFPRSFPSVRSVRYFAGFPEHSLQYIEALLQLQCDTPAELPHTLHLLKQLSTPKGYREQEIIWVDMQGITNGSTKTLHLTCTMSTQPGWEEAGSNVDTGRTMSVLSQMLLRGEIQATGVHAPESVVAWKPFFRALAQRNMYVSCNGKKIVLS